MTQNSEHRLIHRTLASLDEQRKAAGLAPLATPVGTSPRSAQANAQVQQQQYSQNLATQQAGSAQVKAATDANFAAKKTISDLSSLYENGTFTGTADQMAELNDAQGKLNYTNKTLDAQSRIAANAADTSGQQTLDALALGGKQQTYDPKTGITQLSGQGNLEQAAITRLRESGLNDQQIAEKMKDPEYMNAIRTTMSNTGLESTARQSAVLTPAQAQNILATSRSPKERAAAQKVIDDQVNSVKGYDQVPQYNKDGQLVGYSNVENAAKTQENQQKEKERLALEESNRLKAQENKDALKKFTAGIDTTQVDQTKTQIDELMASVKNLSPDLQAAVLPSLISLQQSNNDITKEVNEIIGSQPTDEEIQANYGSLEKYIQSEDAKYKALIARNMETAKEVATYNRDMLEAEKAIIEHDAAVAEQKQVIANAEGEKQLRRQLNRLGIQTDVQGLTYLQNEVQKGVDALENLKTANNLVSLKAQLAIGEGYRLEVKQAMETYEGNYLNITSQTTERLNAIKQSISTAKADRNKEIKEARKWGLEQKNANDRAAGDRIYNANLAMINQIESQKDRDLRSEENRLNREDRADARYEAALARGDAAAARIESTSSSTMLRELDRLTKRMNSDPVLKPYAEVKMKYQTVTADVERTMEQYKQYQAGKVDKPTMNFVDQGLINAINKMWDESSVVRESEYARTPEGLSIKRRMEAWISNKLNGGILNDSERADLKSSLDTMYNVWKTAADDSLGKFYLQINKTNSQLLPQDRLSPEDFGLPATNSAGEGIDEEYDNGSIETLLQGNAGGDEIITHAIGGRKVVGSNAAVSALQQADDEFFADHGQHIFANSSYRSSEQQKQAWDRYQKGEIALAAPPGKSLHEKGIAFDITNWKEAEPYLVRAGFNPLPKNLRKNDPAHFSFGTIG